MSHIDAEEALGIYKRFCKQTEKVMEYLGVARKLQNLLNVPIPTLKHVSCYAIPWHTAHRLFYFLRRRPFLWRVRCRNISTTLSLNKIASSTKLRSKAWTEIIDLEILHLNPRVTKKVCRLDAICVPFMIKSIASDKPAGMPSEAATSKPVASISAPTKKQDSVDLFDSIDEPTSQPQYVVRICRLVGTNRLSRPQVQMQIPGNPFNPTMTGQPFLQAQATGFYQTQSPTNNPFGLQIPQVTGIPVSTFVPNQSVGMFSAQQPNFAQSQPIGVNPFRMSVLVPQTTGMAMFNVNGGASTVPLSMNTFSTGSPGPFANPFLVNSTDFLQQQPQQQQPPFAPVPSFGASLFNSTPGGGNSKTGAPARPGSAPLTTIGPSATSMSPPTPQPVKTHQTGSRNPFGRVATPPPPVPRTPTIMELTMKQFGQNQSASNFNPSMVGTNGDQNRSQPAGAGGFLSNSQFGLSSGALSVGATDMSGVASTFSFNPTSKQNPSPSSPSIASGPGLNGLGGAVSVMNPQNTVAGSTFSGSLWPSSLPSQQTGATPASIAPSITFSGPGFGSSALTSNPTGAGGLQSQATGFGGLKPFKPSSSFGAALLDSLPPVPSSPLSNGPSSASPGTNLNSTPTSIGDISGFGSNSGSSLTPSANAISYSPFGTGIQQQTPQPIANGAPKTMLGVGLRPQMTGGTVNPFRASMVLNGAGGTNIGNPGGGSIPPLPTMNFQPQHPQQGGPGGAFPGNTFNANGGNGASMFNGNFGGQPQQQSQSLI